MKRVAILGSTGSIGTQSLDVIKGHPGDFVVSALTCGRNIELFRKQLTEFRPAFAATADAEAASILSAEFPGIRFAAGMGGICEAAGLPDTDIVINSLLGMMGLRPTFAAIEAGKDVAFANKETLVAGGEIIKKALKNSSSRLYPIDSEHSAIWQCLHGNETKEVSRLIITASGGSFRDRTREELEGVTVEQALHHPNWSMGAKITIDSATMVNKAFEVIEAHYLFDMPYDKIAVLLHPESIVHSMVEFNDHAVLAQLGQADMRIPIQYAMRYPSHAGEVGEERLDLAKIGALHFREVDEERYPVMKVVRLLAAYGGNFGAVFNGANDAAVELFLKQKITFLEIEKAIFGALKEMSFVSDPTVEDIIEAHAYGQRYVTEHFAK